MQTQDPLSRHRRLLKNTAIRESERLIGFLEAGSWATSFHGPAAVRGQQQMLQNPGLVGAGLGFNPQAP